MSMVALQPASRRAQGVGPIVVMDVSGCGKTSVGQRLADYLGAPFAEGDALHPPANVRKMRIGRPLDDEDRWPWLDLIGAKLGSEDNLVVSCSALKRPYRNHLRLLAGRRLTFVFLQGSRTLLASRLADRKDHFMPLSLLDSQFAALDLPVDETDVLTVEIDQSLERIVALALSGLVTLESRRRHNIDDCRRKQ